MNKHCFREFIHANKNKLPGARHPDSLPGYTGCRCNQRLHVARLRDYVLQYQTNEKLTLRTGYSYADAPWKDVNTLFNVLAPATVEQHASVGATYNLDKQSRINFAYTHAFRNTIEGTSTITGPQTGYVRMLQNIVQISYSRDLGIQSNRDRP